MNQEVEIKWFTRNKKRYVDLGYEFTKFSDTFLVKLKDLEENSNYRVHAKCDECNCDIITPYRNYNRIVKNNGGYYCRKCNAKNVSEIRINNNKESKVEKFNDKIKELGYDTIATDNDYIGCKEPMPFICQKYGLQYLSLDQVNQGVICPECGKLLKGKQSLLSKDEIINIVESNDGCKLLNPEDYVNCFEKNLKIKCKTCDNIITTSISIFKVTTGKCSKCINKESVGESIIREFLELHNIKYKQEKRFEDCKNIHCLPFDFYLEEFNTCIEFDGKHHFCDVNYEGQYEKVKFRDSIKDDYCKENNIKLIRIPYYERDNIEKIIEENILIQSKI